MIQVARGYLHHILLQGTKGEHMEDAWTASAQQGSGNRYASRCPLGVPGGGILANPRCTRIYWEGAYSARYPEMHATSHPTGWTGAVPASHLRRWCSMSS